MMTHELMTGGIRHVPVPGPGAVLAGIGTDLDIRLNLPSRATRLSAQEITQLLSRLTVDEIMTRSVVTIGPDRPAGEGAQLMRAFVRTTAPASSFRP